MSTLSADEFESVFERLHQLSKTATFDIKTTEAQHYRRFVLQKKVAERREGIASVHVNVSPDAIGRAPRGLNDGKGFVFISHKGDVYPSGFLALAAGNIREQRLETIYCESLLFRGLRDTSMLEGKCGKCEFKEICGGSRSRSHVLTGNPYAEEPCCSYIPRGYLPEVNQQPRLARLHVLQGA